MNAQTQIVPTDQQKLSGELEILKPQLEKVLPAHVSPDKFMRVVMTAIAQSPDLRGADRPSLLTACVKCATDGLLPDGREAALVIFVSKGVKKVQYMPMVGGILKKVRNSGELLSISSNVVREKDLFRYWIDDAGEHITFEPNLKDADRGAFLCVFAIAKTKDGGVYTEVMSRSQIEQVKAVSKSGTNGPWGPWFDEMSRKSVIRRLSKRLPMSTDLEAVIHRDDELYELGTRSATAKSGTDATKALLGLPLLPDADDAAAGMTVDMDTGEVTEGAADKPQPLPGFDADKAEKAIRACKTHKDYVRELTEVKKLLNGAEMPLNVEAACDEMNDKLNAPKGE